MEWIWFRCVLNIYASVHVITLVEGRGCDTLWGRQTMEKYLVTHWLGQLPLSCIMVPFESIVEFLAPSWSFVIGFVLLVMLVLVLVSWLVVWWMMWFMCVKPLMCWWWIPLFALDSLEVVNFLRGPWVHKLRYWSSYMWRLRPWNTHLWGYVGTHYYGVLGVLGCLGLEPAHMVVWWPLDAI